MGSAVPMKGSRLREAEGLVQRHGETQDSESCRDASIPASPLVPCALPPVNLLLSLQRDFKVSQGRVAHLLFVHC